MREQLHISWEQNNYFDRQAGLLISDTGHVNNCTASSVCCLIEVDQWSTRFPNLSRAWRDQSGVIQLWQRPLTLPVMNIL